MLEQPKPAPGPEIKLSDIPQRSGTQMTTPQPLLDAINAEAAKNGGGEAKLPDPPSDTPPPDKTPQTPPQREITPKPEAKPEPKPAVEPAGKKKEGIESVREALERAQKKATDLEGSLTATAKEKADAFAKLADLEAKAQKYEQDIEKEYKPRVARLEQAEKELQRQREILKIKAYQETSEFHDTYVKPLADARAEVNELLGEMIVSDGENQRPATVQDFDEILAAKSINEAARLAAQKFGPELSQQVVNYRQKIRSLERSRQEAVKNAALNAEEYEKRNREQMAEHSRAVRERILSEATRLIQGDVNIAVPEGDDELKAALKEGQQLADNLLNGNPNISQDEFLSHIGKGRAAIIAHPVLTKKLTKATARIAELEEQLKQYQQSEPDVRGRTGASKPVASSSSQDAKEALLKAAQGLAVAR
jgi:hypothetical protein